MSRAVKRRVGRRQRGFTLVEMIVATLLLVIGVAACLGAIAVSTRVTGAASEYTNVSVLADQRFSELESDPQNMTTGEQSGEFQDHPGYTWSQSIEQTDITGLLRVSLTIEWTDGQSRKSALFMTYEPQPQTTTGS